METSVQVLVYTTTDLHGYDIAAFADRLREGWSIGQNGKCIVIVYKPLTIEPKEDVTMRTSYGRLFRGGFTNYAGTLSGFDGFGRRS